MQSTLKKGLFAPAILGLSLTYMTPATAYEIFEFSLFFTDGYVLAQDTQIDFGGVIGPGDFSDYGWDVSFNNSLVEGLGTASWHVTNHSYDSYEDAWIFGFYLLKVSPRVNNAGPTKRVARLGAPCISSWHIRWRG